MNGPLFLFATPQSTPGWYQNSLTNALRIVAQKSKNHLPQDIYAIIEEAAGRTFVHESYINDMYAANPGQPFHQDPLFVYYGYKACLVSLLKAVGRPGNEGTPRGRICHNINAHLQDILTVIRSKGNDVAQLFKDPERNRLLVNFTSVV